jgi:hydroxymethylglutaryl-CoA lyase
VTLRDGLQLTAKSLPTDRKVQIIRELLALGVPTLEIGSMARPDLVPPLADTLEVVAALELEELERCWIWVATPRHVEKAAAAGARNFQYCFSASDSHNKANIGRSTEDSVAGESRCRPTATRSRRQSNCVSPPRSRALRGLTDPEPVRVAGDPRTAGADDIVVCDTIGQAITTQVSDLIHGLRERTPQRRIVFHGHDTWGLGVANTLAAIDAGATLVDGSLGGLGGCPFAPGASGNTSTEDLLFATRPDWFTPSTLASMVEITDKLLAELGEPNRSRSAQGARSKSTAFEWVTGSSGDRTCRDG